MVPSKLLATRKSISIWYFFLNLGGVIIVYCIPDSLVYDFINNDESHILIMFHIIHIISIITYYMASWCNPGYVEYLPSSPLSNIDSYALNSINSYCKQCKFIRPLQSKHCKSCNRCVTKFDHHCGWIANCVGYKNHKIYLLYVITQFIITAFAFYLSIHSLLLRHKNDANSSKPISIFGLFKYTPLYMLYYLYRCLFQIIYQILIPNDTNHDDNEYDFSLINMARIVLFFGMLIGVIFSSMLGLWNIYLIITNQSTYSIYIRSKYGEQLINDDKKESDKIESKHKIKATIYRCKYLWCNALPANIKSYCCGQIEDKYIKATPPSFIPQGLY